MLSRISDMIYFCHGTNPLDETIGLCFIWEHVEFGINTLYCTYVYMQLYVLDRVFLFGAGGSGLNAQLSLK